MYIPTTLPDETLFSRYVRHLTICGMKEKDYLKKLFNKPRISIHPYLTIGISRSALISEEDESQIFNEQTLGRLFAYFLPHRAKDIYSALLTDNGSSAVRASQLVCFKESETLSLKFCPLCAQKDIESHGVSYWHRVHQIPGVEACSIHQVWLIHQDLPERPHIKPNLLPKSDAFEDPCSLLSFNFAQFSHAFLNQITNTRGSFSQNRLIAKLHRLGYVTINHRFRRKKLASQFFSFAKDLKYKSFDLLPQSDRDYRYLSYLLSGQVSQHPFKYLLIEFWLSAIQQNDIADHNPQFQKESLQAGTHLKRKCKNLLKQGKSLAEVSRITGKSRCFLKSLAVREKIPINIKSYILTDDVKNNIITMASRGFHRNAIANRIHISVGSVEQIISSEQGLVEKRKRYKFESKRRRHKAQILRTMQQQPKAIKQEIKQACYAAFHWLYSHERDWLNDTLPCPIKPKCGNNRPVI